MPFGISFKGKQSEPPTVKERSTRLMRLDTSDVYTMAESSMMLAQNHLAQYRQNTDLKARLDQAILAEQQVEAAAAAMVELTSRLFDQLAAEAK
jgi:hypothetical protein